MREVDATVGGIRALEVPESGMSEVRKFYPDGYLAPATPGPFYIGVEKPMGVYTWDNLIDGQHITVSARVDHQGLRKLIKILEANGALLDDAKKSK